MNYLRYTLWPFIKVKCVYFWWIIKYRGKKNIPPELIFKQMERSMARFAENMEQAFRHMPEDMNESEKREVLDLMGLTKKLEEEVKRLEKEGPKHEA